VVRSHVRYCSVVQPRRTTSRPYLARLWYARIRAHLAEHPGDWPGAYRVMLDVLSGGRADHDAPAVLAMRRNAAGVEGGMPAEGQPRQRRSAITGRWSDGNTPSTASENRRTPSTSTC
jgi:hypothetical protein